MAMDRLTEPEFKFKDVWPELEQGLDVIFHCRGLSAKDNMELYTLVYNYCTRTPKLDNNTDTPQGAVFTGRELYAKLREYLETLLDTLYEEAATLLGESLLRFLNRKWTDYKSSCKTFAQVCRYLNNYWVKRERGENATGVFELYPLGMVVWRERLFKRLKGDICGAVYKLVESERNGMTIDSMLISGTTDCLIALGIESEAGGSPPANADGRDTMETDREPAVSTLGVYQEFFETEFLQRTRDFYSAEANASHERMTTTEYMKKVEARLAEEEARVQNYLHASTRPKLIAVCEAVLICSFLEQLQAEFHKLLVSERNEDLKRMYKLLCRVPKGLGPLREALEEFVVLAGEATMEQSVDTALEDPKLYVEELLRVYRKFAALVVDAFENDASFVAALDKACRKIVNTNAVTRRAKSTAKSPEQIARYCDTLLKSSARNPEERELESTLTSIMLIFKYLEDKDVFQKFYTKMLAKRLVNGTSASDDAEETMISKLREACGFEYTSKLQRMFTDTRLSVELNQEFQRTLERREKTLALDFTIQVLGSGAWPLQAAASNFAVPAELTAGISAFEQFYTNKHSGRKLSWLHQLGKGEVKTSFLDKPYLLQASTYQMALLLMYNSADELTVDELAAGTQLEESLLKSVIGTLLKCKLLLAEVEADDAGNLRGDSVVRLNTKFRSKKLRIKIDIPIKQEMKQETEETNRNVEADRSMLIQACIVRIMKTRKVLKHALLVGEVVQQLNARFKPRVPSIKKAVDILIEKGYLERTDDSHDTYSYVA